MTTEDPTYAPESTVEMLLDDARLARAENTVKNYVIASMVSGVVPFPLIDMGLVTAVQLKMVHGLCKHYEVKFTKNIAKSLISSLLGGMLSVTAAVALTSLIKSVPVAGTLVGGASMAITSGALTYAIGQVFIMHFESGGSLLNFNARNFREAFKEKFEAGKKVAKDMREEMMGNDKSSTTGTR